MSNVISFARREPVQSRSAQLGALTACFATARRVSEDVFWLKENAELLNVLQASGREVPAETLTPYSEFYASAMERMVFFPQYYRFLLGISLDLEDLGLQQGVGTQLCDHVARHRLYDAELSDLQRGETMRLLARRGHPIHDSAGLTERLYRFVRRCETFAVPNRKAAYELTHILFYLSDYGRLTLRVDAEVERSLTYTGILALLEDNLDLLAEVCVAMRYGGLTPPKPWEGLITTAAKAVQIQTGHDGQGDDYHCYLMMNWAMATSGQNVFTDEVSSKGTAFYQRHEPMGALRALSYMLYNHNEYRVKEWSSMKRHAGQYLSHPVIAHIDFVRSTTPFFDEFLAAFVRATPGLTNQTAAPTLKEL